MRSRQLGPDVANMEFGDLAGPQAATAGETEQRWFQSRVFSNPGIDPIIS
jgi:hypothetical protein